ASSTRCLISTSCAHLEPCWPPCPSVTSTYSTAYPNTSRAFTRGRLDIAAWLTDDFWDNVAAPGVRVTLTGCATAPRRSGRRCLVGRRRVSRRFKAWTSPRRNDAFRESCWG